MVLPGNNNISPQWLRTAEAAIYSGVSLRTLAAWLKNGLRHSKVRGCTLIKRSWLDDYIMAYETGDPETVARIVNDIVQGVIG